MPFPVPILITYCIIDSFIGILPYMIDRLVAPTYTNFLATLLFPCARVSLEFIDSFGNTGSLLSIANTQFENTALIQLASITGIWGIAFMVYWFASVSN